MKYLLLYLILTCHASASNGIEELLKKYFESIREEDAFDLNSCFLSKDELASYYKWRVASSETVDKSYTAFMKLISADVDVITKKANNNIKRKNQIYLTEFYPLKFNSDGSMAVIKDKELSKLNYIPALLVTFHWRTRDLNSTRQVAFISGSLLKNQDKWKFSERFKQPYLLEYQFIYALSKRGDGVRQRNDASQ